jgi:hypothetical protein
LEGEVFLSDLAGDDGEAGFAVEEAGEAEALVVGGEEGGSSTRGRIERHARARALPGKGEVRSRDFADAAEEGLEHSFKEGGGDEGHVAGEEEDSVGAGAGERGKDAAEGAAAREGVAAEDADGKLESGGEGADVAEEGAAAKADAGFIATHAGAEAAGEDDDFKMNVRHLVELR